MISKVQQVIFIIWITRYCSFIITVSLSLHDSFDIHHIFSNCALTNVLLISRLRLAGNGFDRRNEIDLPKRNSDLDSTHHVPVGTTDTTSGTDGNGNEVLIMNTKNDERPTSFFAQPGILAGKYFICKETFKKIWSGWKSFWNIERTF